MGPEHSTQNQDPYKFQLLRREATIKSRLTTIDQVLATIPWYRILKRRKMRKIKLEDKQNLAELHTQQQFEANIDQFIKSAEEKLNSTNE